MVSKAADRRRPDEEKNLFFVIMLQGYTPVTSKNSSKKSFALNVAEKEESNSLLHPLS